MIDIFIISDQDAKLCKHFFVRLENYLDAIVSGNKTAIAKKRKSLQRVFELYFVINTALATALALQTAAMTKQAKRMTEQELAKLN